MTRSSRPGHHRHAFSIVELLVVIGIIAILISLLMPALQKARVHARTVACLSNQRQIGQAMLMYANDNRGWLFPPDRGLIVPPSERWYRFVLKYPPPQDQTSQEARDWTPPIMLCPADDPEPTYYHSYLVNGHMVEHTITYTKAGKLPGGLDTSNVVVLGEKLTLGTNYYVEILSGRSTYFEQVDEVRHGRSYGSNYLFLDLHAGPREKNLPVYGADPWDFPSDGN